MCHTPSRVPKFGRFLMQILTDFDDATVRYCNYVRARAEIELYDRLHDWIVDCEQRQRGAAGDFPLISAPFSVDFAIGNTISAP